MHSHTLYDRELSLYPNSLYTNNREQIISYVIDGRKSLIFLPLKNDIAHTLARKHTHTHTHTHTHIYIYIYILAHWPSGLSVWQWSERPGFNPRSRHTKDFKNGNPYHSAIEDTYQE